MPSHYYDYIIIGNGLAGTYAALKAAKFGSVALLGKSIFTETSSHHAQGGIAAALNPDDNPQNHFFDTLNTGRGLGDEKAIQKLVKDGIPRIKELIDCGMPFDMEKGMLVFSREGGHSKNRILQSNGSSTGKNLMNFLRTKIENNTNIHVIEPARVSALNAIENHCYGCKAIIDGREINLFAQNTILASGGAAALYGRTTNPVGTKGEGIALAYNAGAIVRDLEFIQFHPTAVNHPGQDTFLLSESLRGEGAFLLNNLGKRIMEDHHPEMELAPRDIVARAIFLEMNQDKHSRVFLSLKHLTNKNVLKNKYANIDLFCRKVGFDLFEDLIPVAPAAHYSIGGIATDTNGQTSVERLYAIGEVASTGVHGANRLASNSLLECLVFAHRAIERSKEDPDIKNQVPSYLKSNCEYLSKSENKAFDIGFLMDKLVGQVRTEHGLLEALSELKMIEHEHENSPEVRLQIKAAELIVRSSLLRQESRGVFFREDFPYPQKSIYHTLIDQDGERLLAKQTGKKYEYA